MEGSLEQRFKRFLQSLSGSECLDEGHFKFPDGIQKADFLLKRRNVIAELKTITTDQSPKAEAELQKLVKKKGGLIFGTINISSLFVSAEEEVRFHRKFGEKITRSVEQMCREANNQISDTADFLQIDATGILIILNEKISILNPTAVVGKVCEYLNKKPRKFQYCLLVFESHKATGEHASQSQCILIQEFRPEDTEIEAYLLGLMERWAAYNESEFVDGGIFQPRTHTIRFGS